MAPNGIAWSQYFSDEFTLTNYNHPKDFSSCQVETEVSAVKEKKANKYSSLDVISRLSSQEFAPRPKCISWEPRLVVSWNQTRLGNPERPVPSWRREMICPVRDRGASCAPSVTTAPQRIPSHLVGPRRVCLRPAQITCLFLKPGTKQASGGRLRRY